MLGGCCLPSYLKDIKTFKNQFQRKSIQNVPVTIKLINKRNDAFSVYGIYLHFFGVRHGESRLQTWWKKGVFISVWKVYQYKNLLHERPYKISNLFLSFRLYGTSALIRSVCFLTLLLFLWSSCKGSTFRRGTLTWEVR